MNEQRSYWGVVPGEVLHDRELTSAAKLLYLVLSSMAQSNGYCWPSNETLAAEMDLSKRRVRELLAQLQERGCIRVEVRRSEESNEVERRYIYCGVFVGKKTPPPSGEISPDPPARNFLPSGENSPDPPAKSRRYLIGRTNKEEHIPPLPPRGDGQRKERKKDKSVPKWKPERFEAFWTYYRANVRKDDRMGAVRAWDKLRPDDALIAVMGKALRAQLASELWQKGIGIPYAKTWLNNRRWEDEPEAPRDPDPDEEEHFGWH